MDDIRDLTQFSDSVKNILGILRSPSFSKISLVSEVKDKLELLQTILFGINQEVEDAHEQSSSIRSVWGSPHTLKVATYEIEDILDLITTQDLEWRVNGSMTRFLAFFGKKLQHKKLAEELDDICRRLQKLTVPNRDYAFIQNSREVALSDGCITRVNYSSVLESEVFGREDDKVRVLDCLLNGLGYDVKQPRVLPIIAGGGMGKTTLVQLVMNDARVAQMFEVRIWINISNKFDMRTAVLNIVQSATGESYSCLDMEALLGKLRDVLFGKTYLIVLDDVWLEDSREWWKLMDLLAVGERRSTIIVMTREHSAASRTGTMIPYYLRELSDMDSWSMFLKYAFSEAEEKAHPLLVEMGKSIVAKCRGVPLAVKTVGSLLRNERDHRYWKRVEKSELWEIDQEYPSYILPALAVSFYQIPHLLRLCFASCAMFGKGDPLYRNDLISLWMARGFLQCGDGSTEDALDLGDRCFDELISRSFFQLPGYSITKKHAMIHMGYEGAISQEFRTYDGKVMCVEMHALLHDLASYAAGEETVVVGNRTSSVSSRAMHLVWDREEHLAEHFSILRANKARTFAFLYPMDNISKSFLDALISNFSCLRILIFNCCALKKLPESIGNLKHLRYLGLRGNSQLELLPRSVCNLVNLNVLDLGECKCLEMLPENVHRLISLRTLMLTFRFKRLQEKALRGWNSLQVLKLVSSPNLESLSEGFGSLTSLKVLMIQECHSLVHLPKSICRLTNLEHITLESCRELSLVGWAGLSDLVSLQVLVIDNLPRLLWIPFIDNGSRTLQYLKVSNCKYFSSFPESLQNCTSLLKLQVFNCPSLTSLPSGIQGLSRLQELRISRCPALSQRCEREIGDQWHLIAHIREVYTDEKVIQSHDVPTNQAQAGATFKETTLKYGWSGGDSLSNQTERPSPISPDEVTQLTSPTPTEIVPVWYEYQHRYHAVSAAEHHGPALCVGSDNQGNEHDPETESCSDSNVDDGIAAFKETTLKSGVPGGESLSNQIEVTPTLREGFENQLNQGTDDNNNGINKEEAKRLLFLFSEGYEFEKLMLIQLWMALGLLSDEPMEENGAYYFESLVSEGYILCSVPNSLYRVNLEKPSIEDRSYIKLDSTRRISGSSTETLHVSVLCDEINASVFQTLRGFSRLRTLLFLGSYGSGLQQVPRDLFLCYESLEALDLSGTRIKELPSSAGKMINLRYLDLSWTLIELLPEMIDRFKKLQTLKLEGCSCLHRLPNEMKGLTNLRHLHLDVLSELTAFPEGMGALVNIRTLSGFPVGTEQGLRISELKYLDHITGSFCIAKLENVESADVAKEALLNNKKNIKKLKLRWSNPKIQHPKNEAESILQNLCPCSDVEEIQIVCYPGIKLPDWIADVSFDKLVSITLFGCVRVNMLPSIGKLPSLASLELISLNGVTNMDFKGVEVDYVAFPKLQKLSVDGMMSLQTWAEAEKGDYPCLLELSIKDCPKLRQFPSVVYVPIIEHLEVSGCNSLALVSDERLSVSLEQLIVENCPLMEDRCCKDGGEDWHKIQHVPIIWVNEVAIQSIENTA